MKQSSQQTKTLNTNVCRQKLYLENAAFRPPVATDPSDEVIEKGTFQKSVTGKDFIGNQSANSQKPKLHCKHFLGPLL
jgi:hypothetical protein